MQSNLAFIFPGQGSQSVGMMAELGEKYSLVRELYKEASDVLNYDLWQISQEDPEEKLNRTEVTQPALLVASYCVWRIWTEKQGKIPSILAGHSLGEYTALVCAQALDFKDAVQIVAKRGQFMQQAVPEGVGAMAAIVGLEDNDVASICEQALANTQEVLSPANFNSPGQIVIGGHKQAVERAMALATDAGAKLVKMLPMSVPSHCLLMLPAAEQLALELNKISIRAPQIPIIHNTDVAEHTTPKAIREALKQQLYNPVRWVEIIQLLKKRGIENIVEAGPGRVLTGLNKRIERGLNTYPVYDEETLEKALMSLN